MTEAEQIAIELVAYFKASTFLLWTEQSMSLINEIARQQAKFSCNFAMDRILDQCQELADEQNLDLYDILHKHAGWQYYLDVIDAINDLPMDDNDN